MDKLETCTVYGIDFSGLKEKQIHEIINAFLVKHDRTTSKVSRSMLKRMTKGYWNLNKETGTYVVFTPNETNTGGKFFESLEPQYNWLVQILYHKHFPEGSPQKGANFVSEWFEFMSRPIKLLEVRKDGEGPII